MRSKWLNDIKVPRKIPPLFLLLCLLAFGTDPVFVAAQSDAAVRVEGPVGAENGRDAAVARVVERLEAEIRAAMENGRIPSMTVALTDREGELWAGAFGESNRWAATQASTETVYLIGSTFKAQSTIGLLQQLELGHFRLDDPINPYLTEFQIREEQGFPVTFRHLLTHTSGLPAAYGGHDVWGETVPDPLPDYLRRSLRVEGPPMEKVVYSNLAYTLVGYLVEHFSGIPYKEYIQERVWAPIGMNTTAFQPTPSMEERLSIPYAPDRRTGELAPAGRTKADVWPAGIVYGTVHDQASWVRFNLGDGSVKGGRLLQPETMDLMHSLQFPSFSGGRMGGGWGYDRAGYGLTWWTSTRDGERFFAHSGSVSGYTAFVAGNRTRGFGIAVLTNGNRAHQHLVPICNLALDLLAEEFGESR